MDMEKRRPELSGKAKEKPGYNIFFSGSLRKGQMFVIAGLIMLIGFFLLRGVFGIYTTLEEKKFQETIIIDRELKNIVHEYEKIIIASRLQGNANSTAILNLLDFSTFLRDDEDIEILYALVSLNNTMYTVTVGNFLNDNINVTVSASDSTPASTTVGVVNDKRNGTASFSADVSSGVINVTLTYNRRGDNTTEIIPLRVAPPTQERSMLQLFLDAKLKNKEDFVRVKSTFNATW